MPDIDLTARPCDRRTAERCSLAVIARTREAARDILPLAAGEAGNAALLTLLPQTVAGLDRCAEVEGMHCPFRPYFDEQTLDLSFRGASDQKFRCPCRQTEFLQVFQSRFWPDAISEKDLLGAFLDVGGEKGLRGILCQLNRKRKSPRQVHFRSDPHDGAVHWEVVDKAHDRGQATPALPCAPGGTFAEAASRAKVPWTAVFLECRKWGVSAGRATDIAEESSAEARLRSLLREFANAAHYYAWVTKTAIHFAVDFLRREGRTVSLASAGELAYPTSDRAANSELIASALETLSALHQAILRLTYEEGLTLDEIAARHFANEGGSRHAKVLRVDRLREEALSTLRRFLRRNGFHDESHR